MAELFSLILKKKQIPRFLHVTHPCLQKSNHRVRDDSVPTVAAGVLTNPGITRLVWLPVWLKEPLHSKLPSAEVVWIWIQQAPTGAVVFRSPQSVYLIDGFCAIMVKQLFGTAVLSGSPIVHMPNQRARGFSESETKWNDGKCCFHWKTNEFPHVHSVKLNFSALKTEFEANQVVKRLQFCFSGRSESCLCFKVFILETFQSLENCWLLLWNSEI